MSQKLDKSKLLWKTIFFSGEPLKTGKFQSFDRVLLCRKVKMKQKKP